MYIHTVHGHANLAKPEISEQMQALSTTENHRLPPAPLVLVQDQQKEDTPASSAKAKTVVVVIYIIITTSSFARRKQVNSNHHNTFQDVFVFDVCSFSADPADPFLSSSRLRHRRHELRQQRQQQQQHRRLVVVVVSDDPRGYGGDEVSGGSGTIGVLQSRAGAESRSESRDDRVGRRGSGRAASRGTRTRPIVTTTIGRVGSEGRPGSVSRVVGARTGTATTTAIRRRRRIGRLGRPGGVRTAIPPILEGDPRYTTRDDQRPRSGGRGTGA